MLLLTAETLSCPLRLRVSPCLVTPKALRSHMLFVCHSLRGDWIFLPEGKREFPDAHVFVLRNDHAAQTWARFVQKYCSESGFLRSAHSHPWRSSAVTRAGHHLQQRNHSSGRSLGSRLIIEQNPRERELLLSS